MIPVRTATFCLILFVFAAISFPQQFQYFPDGIYRQNVPAPESVLGYEIGAYFTDHEQMLDYMSRLGESAADRVRVFEIGQSLERRKMILVVISAPENIARLEEIRSQVAKLKDPRRTSATEAQEIARRIPAIGWMNYANDGNESAAFEAAMQVAYQLAAGEDTLTKAILQNTVTVINPAHNPESHQRYVAWMKASIVGPQGNPDPNAQEHRGDWRMNTNYNHYQIDLNRDAHAITQPETEIVVRELHRWNPQVFADHHGETNEFFFAPYALPVNMNLPAAIKDWAELFGKNNAEAFNRYRWTYYAREIFDLHYPGYWDSYPALNGAIGMTYETDGGGSKGLSFRRDDQSILTQREAIHHHFIASLTTLKTLADNREKMLQYFYDFRASGMAAAKKETPQAVAIRPGKDPGREAEFIALMMKHQIEVYRAESEFTAEAADYLSKKFHSQRFEKGVYLIPFDQPQKRLIRALLDPDSPMEPEFMKRAAEKYEYNRTLGDKAPKEGYGFYDITAWSLPLTYGLEAYTLRLSPAVKTTRLETAPAFFRGLKGGEAHYAYAFTYETNNNAKLLAALLRENFHLAISTQPFETEAAKFPRGSIIARVERNPSKLTQRISHLADSLGAEVYPIRTAWTPQGIFLGSDHLVNLKSPKVLVITEEPSSQTSYGALWYLLEKRYGVPFTPIRLAYFSNVNLYEYEVLVFPDGSANGYKRMLEKADVENIKNWMKQGGVFVGIRGGAVFATLKDVDFTTSERLSEAITETEEEYEEAVKKPAEEEKKAPKMEKEKIKVDYTPGAIYLVTLDTRHYLSLGYPERVPVLVRSDFILKPSQEGANVGWFAKENPRLSGFAWENTDKLYPGNAYLIDEPVGRGHAILFADDPNFRLFWPSLDRLLLNAILLAPSF
ncbi:MAG: M14 family zinc carboxypeptidase [candidate division KSB1 bacterium]|nr:M14 family zinc carboxypeptidase [candidate division KSB1 bacterium]MDZ7309975.1 M14 family zinc carboxypeptidase [candidate division KSB1 bacterium]